MQFAFEPFLQRFLHFLLRFWCVGSAFLLFFFFCSLLGKLEKSVYMHFCSVFIDVYWTKTHHVAFKTVGVPFQKCINVSRRKQCLNRLSGVSAKCTKHVGVNKARIWPLHLPTSSFLLVKYLEAPRIFSSHISNGFRLASANYHEISSLENWRLCRQAILALADQPFQICCHKWVVSGWRYIAGI